MPDKVKKNLLGREVVKSTSTTRNPNGVGFTKSKSKMVFSKDGDALKYKKKVTNYSPSGEPTGKMQSYKPTNTTVSKRKFDSGGNVTSKKTRPGMLPVTRSMKKK